MPGKEHHHMIIMRLASTIKKLPLFQSIMLSLTLLLVLSAIVVSVMSVCMPNPSQTPPVNANRIVIQPDKTPLPTDSSDTPALNPSDPKDDALLALFLPGLGVVLILVCWSSLSSASNHWFSCLPIVVSALILLCSASIGLLIAVRIREASGTIQFIRILAIIINGGILLPFALLIPYLFSALLANRG